MPDFQSQARRPRGAVLINGTATAGWVEFEVENNSYFSADTFRVQFAAALLPSDRNAAWFSAQQDMAIELFAGFPANPDAFSTDDLTSWIYGRVDEIEYDPVQNTIEVHGRDLTSLLIDAKTTEKWPNQTSSQIATLLAQRHGLTPVVTATTQQVGKYYEVDNVSLTDQRTEWDLLTYLAQMEGYRVWIRGQKLYFQPVPDPSKVRPYQLIWSPPTSGAVPAANYEGIKFSRALTVSRGIQVEVRSWNKSQGKGFSVWYPKKGRTAQAGNAKGSGQIYHKTIPNLTMQQATQLAQQLYHQIVAHEMKLQTELPADNVLDTTSIIQVAGTGTAFDQIYYPEGITRRLSVHDGYAMSVRAKNSSPASQVT